MYISLKRRRLRIIKPKYTEIMDIQSTFDDSLRNSALPDAAIDVAEVSIDALLNNDLLKQVPIVKTFLGVAQAGINIHDKLFLKKILSFLSNIDGTDPDERKEIINSIDNSKKYRLKVGEKLLYVIDSCDDHEGAERIAKLFRAVLTKSITYNEYLEASSIIARLSGRELELFLNSYKIGYMYDDASELIHTGLVFSRTEEISVDLRKVTQDDWDDPEEHYETDVSGGEITIMPTAAADTIYEVFGMGREARQKQLNEERERWKQEQANKHRPA